MSLKQCRSCPWRVDCVPDRDIPNGYSCQLHEALRGTIASDLTISPVLRIMACHYSKPGDEFACAGWLYNQLGAGNNITLRLAVLSGQLPPPEVDGPQHASFDDTLPTSDTGLMSEFFKTSDGYMLRRVGTNWTDSDLTFESDDTGWPVDYLGERLDGAFVAEAAPEVDDVTDPASQLSSETDPAI